MFSNRKHVFGMPCFLNKLSSYILVNGFHMKGILKEYDRYAIWIESDHQNQLVYKHAISTIRL
ncbi:RNA chaperone Hfq [Bacillus mycoides]